MVIVTHEMRFARQVSNKIVFIHEGRIGEQGTPDEVFEHPKTEELRRFLNVINEDYIEKHFSKVHKVEPRKVFLIYNYLRSNSCLTLYASGCIGLMKSPMYS